MTSSEIQVERADLDDARHEAAIITLLDFLALAPADGQPLSPAVRKSLVPKLREHPGTHVFLAFAGVKAVGLAVCFDGFSTFRAAPLLNIHDLVVDPEFRARGIGTRLLEHVESFARDTRYCKLSLEVRADGSRARKLYVEFGFDPGDPNSSAQSFLTKDLESQES